MKSGIEIGKGMRERERENRRDLQKNKEIENKNINGQDENKRIDMSKKETKKGNERNYTNEVYNKNIIIRKEKNSNRVNKRKWNEHGHLARHR